MFGVDESDLLLDVIRYSQSLPSLFGANVLPEDMETEYWGFLDRIATNPEPNCLAYRAKIIADSYGLDPQGLANQFPVWFLMFNNMLGMILPIVLAILSVDDDSRIRVEEELPDLDPKSEDTYLNAVILETLRLYNPVFGLERIVTEPVILQGIRFDPGIQLLLPMSTYLRDPRCYPRPNSFEPQRWMGNSGSPLCQDIFSTGIQTCPAKHVALFTLRYVLYLILSQYRYRLTTEYPILDLTSMPQIINPFQISFHVMKIEQ